MVLFNKQKHIISFVFSLALLLAGIFITKWTNFGFYFSGSFAEFQQWFPKFFIIPYCIFKLYFPTLCGIMAFLILDFGLKNIDDILLKGNILINKIAFRAFFLFVIYSVLSWVLPEYYPFSKYPMYSSWASDEAYVFLLRDSSNILLPLQKISNVDGAYMSHVYYSLQNAKIQDSLIGQKLFFFIKKEKLKNSGKYGVISLNKIVLYYKNDKIQTSEIRLYNDKME